MPFGDGDFLMIEYTARRAADNAVVYTTDKKTAEENGLDTKDATFGPTLIVLGKSEVIRGLDKALREMSVGEERKVTLEPKDAFGERDESMLRVMSMADFRKQDINPYPGMQLDLDGATATVKSVNSGRVLVDLNNPLAGERINYDIKVVKKIGDENEKAEAIIESHGIKPSNVSVSDGIVKVSFGAGVKKDANFFTRKSAAINWLFWYMEAKKVEVSEDYTKGEQKGQKGNEEGK